MAWYDVVLGVATGGLYTAGKAIYQAGNAAESAGNAAEEAGMALAVIGSTIQAVGEQLESTLKEAEELLTIQRLTPRSEADLWDEEKARLTSLKQEKTRLENKLKEKGVSNTGSFDFNFWDLITNFNDVMETFQLLARLAAVNKEIHDIFYQEPGVLTTGIYNAKEVLERVNTIEQPMIEDILASLDDNLDVSEEVLQEVKKLFITKKKVPVSITELSPSIRDQLEMLRNDKLYFEKLISRKDIITAQLSDIIRVHPENRYEISVGSIKVPKENIYASNILDEVMNAANMIDTDISIIDVVNDDINITDIIDVKDNNVHIGAGDVVAIDKEKLEDNINIINIKDETKNVDSSTVNRTVRNLSSQPIMRTTAATAATGIKTKAANISAVDMARMATAVSKSPGYAMSVMQPHGAKIAASLSTKFDGYQRNYDLLKAQKAFYFRQSLKMEKKYELLSNEWVEEPGVVPKTLDELHGVLSNLRTEEQPRIDMFLDTLNTNIPQTLNELNGVLGTFRTEEQPRIDILLDSLSTNIPQTLDGLNGVLQNVRTEEQPRIDLILDNVNANLEESKQTLSKANDTMDSVKNALSILDFDTKYLKLGGMVIGGLIVLDLFVGFIVLIRMALGF
ncbi:hypothetical protein [Methanolobus psychrotolerans]|uniref:hypothetical protein n=1 Tax=Methanolobus psychrotolerans TaxID=1874706 RepID=UPI000B91638D|nr:hypothetical protein [Methanolobus psychrotolerans]